VSGFEIVTAKQMIGANTTARIFAQCPAGKRPIGGGMGSSVVTSTLDLHQSFPGGSFEERLWIVVISSSVSFEREVSVFAVCIAA